MPSQEILAAGVSVVGASTNLVQATSDCKNQSAPACATDIDKASDMHSSPSQRYSFCPQNGCYTTIHNNKGFMTNDIPSGGHMVVLD